MRSGMFQYQPENTSLRNLNTGGLLWNKITLIIIINSELDIDA
jgi:hypothetical protein